MQKLFPAIVAAIVMLAAQDNALGADATSATSFYMKYRAAWNDAKSMDPVFPYLVKQVRNEYEATPQAQRQPMFDAMKTSGALRDVKVVREIRKSDGFALDLTATTRDNKPAKGVAEIVIEEGAMKIKSEHWTS